MRRKRLGELLVEAGFIRTEQLNHALKEQKINNEKLGKTLMRLGYITEDTLIEFLSKQHGTPSINLYKEVIDKKAVDLIPRDVAEKYKVIPVGFKSQGGIKFGNKVYFINRMSGDSSPEYSLDEILSTFKIIRE